MLNNIVTLKSGLEVPQGHSTGTTRSLGTVSYSPSIVTIAVSLAFVRYIQRQIMT